MVVGRHHRLDMDTGLLEAAGESRVFKGLTEGACISFR